MGNTTLPDLCTVGQINDMVLGGAGLPSKPGRPAATDRNRPENAKKVQNTPNRLPLLKPRQRETERERKRKHPKAISTFIKVHKNTQNPLRMLPDTTAYCTLSYVETSIWTGF